MESTENSLLLQGVEPVSHVEKSRESKDHAAEEKANRNERQIIMGFPEEPTGESRRTGDPLLLPRQPWSSHLLCCLGTDEEFVMYDRRVCLLGTLLPCVLFGKNMEQLSPGPHSFFYHCCVYSSLSAVSLAIFKNCWLAKWYSFGGRTTLRKMHNLDGHGDYCLYNFQSCMVNSRSNREQCDSCVDFALHCCCHQCALCQEAREIHRRTTHRDQGHLYRTSAPSEQTME